MTNHDRRVQPRIEWSGEAVAAFGAHEVRLRTRDLSSGGCCVETPWCPPTGERVGIVLHVDGEPIGAWAEVAWAARHEVPAQSYVWGLRFVEIERASRLRLEAYVDHCLAVDMLDEMLRGEAPAPSFAAGEIEEMPTRIFDAVATAAYFPVGGEGPHEAEATSEIDVDSTLTSEVPVTHTAVVDMAELYRRATMAPPGGLPPQATVAYPPATEWGPEPIDGGGAPDGSFAPPPQAWGSPGFTEPPVDPSLGWESPVDAAPMGEFVIEPLAAEPRHAPGPAQHHGAAPSLDGDPFWVEPAAWPEPVAAMAPVGWPEPAVASEPVFPSRAPAAWPVPAAAPVQPHYAAPVDDPNSYAKAAPFDAPAGHAGFEPRAFDPPATQPAAFDPSAFDPAAFDASTLDAGALDPSAFDPQALQWSAPGSAPPLEAAPTAEYPPARHEPAPPVIEAPLSADELLELKRRRVEALLSSVPRRDASAAKSGTTKAAPAVGNANLAEPMAKPRPRPRAADADTGLRRLFDEALREIKRDD